MARNYGAGLIAACACLLLATACAQDITKDGGVLVLTDANADEAFAQYGTMLVEFYAPWCGHCKALAPVYSEVATELAKADPPAYVAKVDSTAESALGQKYEIRSFPTLLLIGENGAILKKYQGGRTKAALLDWITVNYGSRPKALADASAIKSLLTSRVAILGVFEEDDYLSIGAFKAAASGIQRVAAGYASTEYGNVKTGQVAVIKTSEEGVSTAVYTGDLHDKKAFVAWVNTFVDKYDSQDYVLALNDDNFDTAIPEFGSMLVAFHDGSSAHQELLNKLGAAATALHKLHPTLRVGQLNTVRNPQIRDRVGASSLPSLLFFCDPHGSATTYTGSQNPDDIASWVTAVSFGKVFRMQVSQISTLRESPDSIAFLAGEGAEFEDRLKVVATVAACMTHIKVVAVPGADAARELGVADNAASLGVKPENRADVIPYTGDFSVVAVADFMRRNSREFEMDNGVVVLTDANFQQAIDKFDAVLVKFYAPWCGHCKAMAPEYAKAAVRLAKENPPFVLAKLDATTNPQIAAVFDVRGYPTVKLVRSGQPFNASIDCDGARGEQQLVDWVHKNRGCVPAVLNNAAELADALTPVFERGIAAAVAYVSNDDIGLSFQKVFDNAIRGLPRLIGVSSFDSELGSESELSPNSFVVLTRDNDKKLNRAVYTGHQDAQLMRRFVERRLPQFEEENGVLVLEDDNFDTAVAVHNVFLLELYAPWCGYCKKLAPEYQLAAETTLKEAGDAAVRLTKCDATVNRKLAERFDLKGYPTLRLICGDITTHEYPGGLSSRDLIDFISSKTTASYEIINTAEELKAFQAVNSIAVVAAFADIKSTAATKFLQMYACGYTWPLAVVSNSGLLRAWDVTITAPGLAVYNSFLKQGFGFKGSLKNSTAVTGFLFDSSSKFPTEDGVVVLSDSNFDQALQEFGGMLVEFYAPWCGHCKALAPQYAAAATLLNKAKCPRPVAKVDATANPVVARRFEVQSYPTMKYLRARGSITPYTGGRSADAISTFVQAQSRSRAEQVFDADTIRKASTTAPLLFVGLYSPQSEASAQIFRAAVDGHKRTAAMYAMDDNIAEQLELPSDFIVAYQTTGSKVEMTEFLGNVHSAAEVNGFVEQFIEQFPKEEGVLVLDDDNFDAAKETFGSMFLEFYAPWCGHCKQLAPQYATAAQNLAAAGITIPLAKIDATIATVTAQKFEVQSYPTLRFMCAGMLQPYEGERTSAALEAFITAKANTEIKTVASSVEAQQQYTTVAVGLFNSLTSEQAKTFQKVAACLDVPMVFGPTSKAPPSIKVFRTFTNSPAVLQTNLTSVADIARFIRGALTEFPEEQDVLVLDDSTFNRALEKHSPLLVEFYAPWCGHCKQLAPHYAAAATKLKAQGIRIAKIDATESRSLGSEFGIRGYPTMKVVRSDRSAKELDAPRTADGIVNSLMAAYGCIPTEATTMGEINRLVGANSVVIVGFMEPGTSEAKTFADSLRGLVDVQAVITNSSKVATELSAEAGSVVAITTVDGVRRVVEFDDTKNVPIRNWAAGLVQKFPRESGVMLLNDDNYDAATREFEDILLLAYDSRAKDAETAEFVIAEAAASLAANGVDVGKLDISVATKTAEKLEIKSTPVILHATENDAAEYHGALQASNVIEWVMANFLATPDAVSDMAELKALQSTYGPVVVGIFAEDDAESRGAFLRALAGSPIVAVAVSSSADIAQQLQVPVPGIGGLNSQGKQAFNGDIFDAAAVLNFAYTVSRSFQEEDGVLVLTDANIQPALSQYGSIFVEYYAPWCTHCKALVPVWKEVAAELRQLDPPIYIAKCDATANKQAGSRFGVERYPTLLMAYAGSEGSTRYTGSREKADLIRWATAQAGSRPTLLRDAEDAKHVVSHSRFIVLGFFEHARSRAAQAFVSAASGWKRVDAAYVVLPSVIAALNGKVNTIVVQRVVEGKVEKTMYSDSLTQVQQIREFISQFIDEFPVADGVTLLDGDNAASGLRTFSPLVVHVHNKETPEEDVKQFSVAARQFAKLDAAVRFASSDVTGDAQLQTQLKAGDVPSVTMFCGGVAKSYTEKLTASSLSSWMRSTLYSNPVVWTSVDVALNVTQKPKQPVVVGFFESLDGPEVATFKRATGCISGMTFALTASRDIAAGLNAAMGTVVVFKNFGSSRETYTGAYTNTSAVVDFILSKGRLFAEEDGVLVLTEATFQDAVDTYGSLMVEFYAPWCGHCKNLAPKYQAAAITLRGEKAPYYLAKVDATENSGLARRFNVSGYPTVMIVRADDHVDEFDGSRDEEGIVEFIRERRPKGMAQAVLKAAGAARKKLRAESRK